MRLSKIAALILLFFLVASTALFVTALSPKNGDATDKTDFIITQGQSTAEISKKLEDQGIIKNSFAFFIYMKLIGNKVLPGTYELNASMPATEIGGILAVGKFKTTKITIIEGWRATQMESYFAEKKLKNVIDFAATAKSYEGYLFPDTYEVKADITTQELIKLMRDNFDKKTTGLKITPETVILASIVEREAKSEDDRPLIAGVYSNRIKQGMKLQADPTVQYAKNENWAAITVDDYQKVISPYNTYLNDGLPPGPICSPGLASLKVAASPAAHDYLYFFHAKGETYFSKTYEEHRSKVAQYF